MQIEMIANYQMMQRQAAAAKAAKGGEIIGVSADGTPIRAESPQPKKKSKRKSSIKKERAAHLSMISALGMTEKEFAAVNF